MNRLPKDAIDPKAALRALPPLIKGYLRLGAFVGDGAVIDHQFGTTDVLIVLPCRRSRQRYIEHFDLSRRAGKASSSISLERCVSARLTAGHPPGKVRVRAHKITKANGMKRLQRAALVLLAIAVLLQPARSLAEYPEQPIRLLLPFPAGGAVDIVARVMAAKMSDDLGKPFIIENKAGAGGIIATDAVAKARPTATRCC